MLTPIIDPSYWHVNRWHALNYEPQFSHHWYNWVGHTYIDVYTCKWKIEYGIGHMRISRRVHPFIHTPCGLAYLQVMYSTAPSYVLYTYKTFMFMCSCICGPHHIDKQVFCVPVHIIQNLFRIGVKAVSTSVSGISTASYCYRYLKPLRTQRLLR